MFLILFSNYRHENERKQAELGVQSSVSKKILVLGAGKVSSPFIEYHTRRQSTGVTVGKFMFIIDIDSSEQSSPPLVI